MKTRSMKHKHRGLLGPFPPGQSVCEGSSGALVYLALVFGASHLDRALTRSVSTSQRQMGSLMQWCSYVRPATAAAPVCLYRSTERERENVKESLWVSRCVCVCWSRYACADTHIRSGVRIEQHCARQMGSEVVNQDELTCCPGFDELVSLFNPSPSIPHTLGNSWYSL